MLAKASIFKRVIDPNNPKKILPDVLDIVEIPTIDDLAEFVSLSEPEFAFSPSVFKGDYRLAKNFLACYFIAIDYDGKGSIEAAIEAYAALNMQFIVGTTMNHQKSKGAGKAPQDRFRVFIPLSEPIYDAALLQYNIEQAALFTWPFLDAAVAKDCSRAFMPCVDIVHTQRAGKLLTPLKEMEYGSVLDKPWVAFVMNTPGEGEGFNGDLYKACKVMQRAGYDEGATLEFMDRFIFQPEFNPSGWNHISRTDEQTITSAMRSDPGDRVYVTKAEYVSGRGRVLGAKDAEGLEEAQLLDKIVKEEAPKVMAVYRGEGNTHYYEIIDYENKIVKKIANEEYLKQRCIIERILTQPEYCHLERTMKMATKIFKAWQELPGVIGREPESLKQIEDRDIWAFSLVELEFDSEGATPAWDQFLERLSAPEDFLAWVWSIYEPQHKGRQILWLYGPHGQDGKSVVLRVLANSIRTASTAINNDNLRTNFGLSLVYGKRLAVYADCLNAHFTQNERMRHLSSGDLQTVEFKGEHPFSAAIYLRIAIGANLMPEINNINAEKSRLMIIQVGPNSNESEDWESDLKKEYPALLYKAYQAYRKLCPLHGQIKTSENTNMLVSNSADVGSEEFETLFNDSFEINIDAEVKASELQEFLRTNNLRGPQGSRFREYLKTRLTLELKLSESTFKRRKKDGWYYVGFRRKGRSDGSLKLTSRR